MYALLRSDRSCPSFIYLVILSVTCQLHLIVNNRFYKKAWCPCYDLMNNHFLLFASVYTLAFECSVLVLADRIISRDLMQISVVCLFDNVCMLFFFLDWKKINTIMIIIPHYLQVLPKYLWKISILCIKIRSWGRHDPLCWLVELQGSASQNG